MQQLTYRPQGQRKFGSSLHLAELIKCVKRCLKRVCVNLTVVINNHVFFSPVQTVKGVHYQEVNNEAEKAETNDCE